jgi:multidrug efflux pump subunit AcrA (membrane-fusion protein)
MLIGVAGSVLAGSIVSVGVAKRAEAAREVAQWTDQQAIPSVSLATLENGGESRSLTLPGTIDAYYKAAIFARVTGYLKSWQADIGARVKAGQQLAFIDAPDLDQQLAQAKADLATATANAHLAAVTAGRWTKLVKSQWVSQQSADDKVGAADATNAAMQAADANVKRLEAMENFKTVVAPFDGVVTARKTDIGALINAGAGMELFEVSDLHKVRIYVHVPRPPRPISVRASRRLSTCRNILVSSSRRPSPRFQTPWTSTRAQCSSSCKPTTPTVRSSPMLIARCNSIFPAIRTFCARPRPHSCRPIKASRSPCWEMTTRSS